MSLVLGDGWPAPVVLPEPDPADTVLERVLLAVQALQATFAALPVPQVTVEPQDLSDIVTAVQSLHGPSGPDAAEIAAAVRDALSPLAQAAPESSAVLTELAAALKQLDFRMQGIGAGGSGGTVATISNDVAVKPAAGTTAFPVTVLSTVGDGGLTDTQLRATPVPVSGSITATTTDNRTLTERMMARAPQSGYALWLDVTSSDATHIYLAEAPTGTTSITALFQGVRLTLDAAGNPLGAAMTATAFAWDSRSTASWAA